MTDGCWRSTLKSMLLIYGVVAIAVLVRLISRAFLASPRFWFDSVRTDSVRIGEIRDQLEQLQCILKEVE
jgi:hypothetical protein